MRRSKLELYHDIVCALAKKAQTADELAYDCSTNCILLQERMDFLVNHEIVTLKVGVDNKAYYVLTQRGLAISKTLDLTKRLEKLKTQTQILLQPLALSSPNNRKRSKLGW
ncbi:MAG: winged helix-turn-helix domain-containing protein [Candidatus Bathyarchaeota archaeon]|nr:winged helix-turn-helix domain-containing protein [Candidatus Bathyarchaeota archaeon]